MDELKCFIIFVAGKLSGTVTTKKNNGAKEALKHYAEIEGFKQITLGRNDSLYAAGGFARGNNLSVVIEAKASPIVISM